MELIKPDKKYLQSYYDACKETWGKVHDNYIIHNPNEYDDWKNHIFEDYEKNENGEGLPIGFVPSKTFWIVENGEYIGTANVRTVLNERLREYGGHVGFVVRFGCRQKGYGEKIAKMMIKKTHQMGVQDVLMTCESTNIASQKILEKLHPKKVEEDNVFLNGKYTDIKRFYYN